MINVTQKLQGFRQQLQDQNQIYLPQFFTLPEHLNEFSKLLDLPGLIVVDFIHDQVRELLKCTNPSKRLSTEQLSSMAAERIGPRPDEYGTWVFYPWSRRLVHILSREEFITVRTSRNQYKITPAERDLLETKKIGVIGLSVGQSVSVTLAMERICGEIRLADFDVLELTNLNRIRTGVYNLGLPKVYSVAREISEIDPYLTVICFPAGLTEQNMDEFFTSGGKLDLLVEESDGFDIKILSRYKARELGVPVLMEASDRCMVDVERFDLESDREILHGIVKNLDIQKLKSLQTNEEKIPYMLDVLGLKSTSARLKASMLEINQTVTTWPQLASAVTMGGGITADVARRILLNQFRSSGRFYVDIEQLIGDKETTRTENVHAGSVSRSTTQMHEALVKFTSGEGLSPQLIEKIAGAVMLAPSYGNRQPWQLYHCKGKLGIFLNESHGRFGRTDHSSALLSFGCAVENACVAANALNHSLSVTISETEELAAFSLSGTPDEKKWSLAKQIAHRRTDRSAASNKPIPPDTIQRLLSGTGKDGTQLEILEDRNRISELMKCVADAEWIRLFGEGFNEELFRTELKDAGRGVDIETLQLPAAMRTVMDVVSDPRVASYVRDWESGEAIIQFYKTVYGSTPAVGLIYSEQDKLSLINAGRALQNLWLEATAEGLSFHPVCLPLYLAESMNDESFLRGRSAKERSCLTDMLEGLTAARGADGRLPVFMFRLFYGSGELKPQGRRSMSEILYTC